MKKTLAEKKLILQAISILAGFLFLFVVTVANYSVYHTTAKHIDSPQQELIIGKNDKIKILLPVLGGIVNKISLENPIPSSTIFEKKSFSAILIILLYLLPPRSPPK